MIFLISSEDRDIIYKKARHLLQKELHDKPSEATEAEMLNLQAKLEKVKGFLRFIENDADPSHTLRSPLVSIKSFLGILEISHYKLEPEELKELAESVNESIDNLLDTIDYFFKR